MFRLDNKTALVTGAGSGIGEAIAHTLAGAGALVYVADRDSANGERVAGAIRTDKGRAGRAEFVELDVTDDAAIARLAGTIDGKHGALDILVNNAGIGHVGTVVTTAGADMDRLYAVNVRGVFNTSKAFIAGMLARKAGVIVNIASIGGVLGIKRSPGLCDDEDGGRRPDEGHGHGPCRRRHPRELCVPGPRRDAVRQGAPARISRS